MKDLVVTHHQALAVLEKQETPEALAILEYVKRIKEKNIAVLGVDEAFVLTSEEGQIKAFKRALTLSKQDGTLIQPLGYGDHVVSAQGYEVWAEATGTSVVFPKEVLVGNEWKPNPYAERDETNRRILAVHASAIAFRYSSMGIPQVSAWTTIFDTPSYRMIDLLAKAKKFPQAFKVLPKDMIPQLTYAKQTKEQKESKEERVPNETWAAYPFDESMNLWINTSHNEVITWLSQILNREKKAMDFAQTFAKRNALKHLSGIQKVPNLTGAKDGPSTWRFPVLAWRPTGNNIVKWDATQYSDLQDRVSKMIGGGETDEFSQKAEIKTGSERVSEEEGFEALEAETDPEDNQDSGVKPVNQEASQPEEKPAEESPETKKEPSKDVNQVMYLAETFPAEYDEARKACGITVPVNMMNAKTAVKLCQKIGELVDQQN